MKTIIIFSLLSLFAILPLTSFAQETSNPTERRERNIKEIKTEAVRRAEVGQYPLIGLDPADIREAMQSIHTKDKDEWAAAFMGVGDHYMKEAQALGKTKPQKRKANTSLDGRF